MEVPREEMTEHITFGDELLSLVYTAPSVEIGMRTIIGLFGEQTAIGLKKYMDSFGSFEKWQAHLKSCKELKEVSHGSKAR